MAGSESTKVVLAALFGNLIITVAKGIAAVVTGSGAMLAETIHSLADTGNQGLKTLLRVVMDPATWDQGCECCH